MTIYCATCGNRIGRNGLKRPEPICGKCLLTPWEIRQRELRGCLTLATDGGAEAVRRIREQEQRDAAEAAQQRFERTSSTVHRSRFSVVKQ